MRTHCSGSDRNRVHSAGTSYDQVIIRWFDLVGPFSDSSSEEKGREDDNHK